MVTGKMSRRIVIDASVGRSAGVSEDPTSRCCREFLEAVLNICHRMVLTPEIEREWNAHRSGFALLWQGAMESRGKIARIGELRDLVREIESAARTPSDCKAMLKDVHLIAAAMAADGVIASRDARARNLFAGIAAEVQGLGKIAWQHVDANNGDAVQWLSAGARTDQSLRLVNGDGK
jgi:hypothetical protein